MKENMDIHSSSKNVETENYRIMVKHTDNGKSIQTEINDLYALLEAYRNGEIDV